jgi:predicted SAM-dependent methyltransferase
VASTTLKQVLLPPYRILNAFINLRSAYYSMLSLPGFLRSYFQFKKNQGSDPLFELKLYPILGENAPSSPIDPHYFYVNSWAMRRVIAQNPEKHYDFASQVVFSSLLSAVVPTIYVDIRPLQVSLDGLSCEAGDLTHLPYGSGSLSSISCLHVIEHVGLSRYGDSLDPDGYLKAANELKRVLANGGNLLIAVPTGISRIYFNAHRVFSVEQCLKMFSGLKLVELSGVMDDGSYVENVDPKVLNACQYGCGFYWFKKEDAT